MAIEIELKAWVDDVAAVREKAVSIGRYSGSFNKDDEYWKSRSPAITGLGSGVRIRRTTATGAALVNFKRKEVRDGMEINDEREFEVSDALTFSELLERLGLLPWIRKRKIGEAWDVDGITAELSEIVGLGNFIELEILADNDEKSTVESARNRLMDALDRLGVDRTRIEARYYTEMLLDAEAGEGRSIKDLRAQRPVL